MTISEFVSDLYDNSRDGVELIDLETAKSDIKTFTEAGWMLPENMTPEAYMEAWNELVKRMKAED